MYPAQSTMLFGAYPILNQAWNEVTQILLNYWYVRFVRKFLDAKTLYPFIDKVGRVIEWIILGFVTAVLISIFKYITVLYSHGRKTDDDFVCHSHKHIYPAES